MRMHSAFTTNPIAFSIIHRGGCVVRVSAMKLVGCGLVRRFELNFPKAGQGCAERAPGSLWQCIKVVYVAIE